MTMELQTRGLVKQPSTHTIYWMFYRCNLRFNEQPSVDLHNEITRHYTRKIEVLQ